MVYLTERALKRVVAGGNGERQSVAITGLCNNSFSVLDKVSINSNLLKINTVKKRISEN